MELNAGTIVKINTKNPETNKEILEELDKQLKRLELHKGQKEEHEDDKHNQIEQKGDQFSWENHCEAMGQSDDEEF
jgi:hypothetical protein